MAPLKQEEEEEEEEEEEKEDEEEESPLDWRFWWFHQSLQAQILYNKNACLHFAAQKLWSS